MTLPCEGCIRQRPINRCAYNPHTHLNNHILCILLLSLFPLCQPHDSISFFLLLTLSLPLLAGDTHIVLPGSLHPLPLGDCDANAVTMVPLPTAIATDHEPGKP